MIPQEIFFFAFKLETMIGHWQFGMLYIVSLILSDIPTAIRHKNDYRYSSLGASGAIYRNFRNESKALAALSTFEPNIESNHIPALERSRFIRRSCRLFKPCN